MIRTLLSALAPLFLLAGAANASPLEGEPAVITLSHTPPFAPGTTVTLSVQGTPGSLVIVGHDTDPGPTTIPFRGGVTVNLGMSPAFGAFTARLDANGFFAIPCTVGCDDPVFGIFYYIQAIVVPPAPGPVCVTNQVTSLWDGDCCTGGMGDFVWEDLNANGIQDLGEPGIPSVALALCDENGVTIDQTVTDGVGAYSFDDVCEGDYTVKLDSDSVPTTLGPVLCQQGVDPAVDSNCQPVSVNLPTDDFYDPTLDFGFSSCAPCDGKVVALSMRYQGAAAAQVDIEAKNIIFSGVLQPGEVFTIFGDDNGTMGKEIEIFVNGVSTEKIHTSCSKPIGPGLTFGDFKVEAGTSEDGGVMCPERNGPCVSGGKPQMLTMRYTGEDCSASSNTQGSKTFCDGDPAFMDPVHIIASDGGSDIYFQGDVNLGTTFIVDATLAGETKFSSNTHIDIYDAANGNLLQELEVHTSCSVPLLLRDQFGSLILEGFVLE